MVWLDAVTGGNLFSCMPQALHLKGLYPFLADAGIPVLRIRKEQEGIRIRNSVPSFVRQRVRIGKAGAVFHRLFQILKRLLDPRDPAAVGEQVIADGGIGKCGKSCPAVFPVILCGMAERLASGLVEVVIPKPLYGFI